MIGKSAQTGDVQSRQQIVEITAKRRLTRREIEGYWRYMWLKLRHPNLHYGYFFLDRGADIQIRHTAQIRVGRGVRISRDFTAFFQGKVCVGNNVFFNRGCHLAVHLGVTIGDNCLFGERVSVHDANHALTPVDQPLASRGFEAEEVVIGTNVWVSANVTILPGVHIGDNAVIGANAVVTHDIPANCVAAGIPARVIKTLA